MDKGERWQEVLRAQGLLDENGIVAPEGHAVAFRFASGSSIYTFEVGDGGKGIPPVMKVETHPDHIKVFFERGAYEIIMWEDLLRVMVHVRT